MTAPSSAEGVGGSISGGVASVMSPGRRPATTWGVGRRQPVPQDADQELFEEGAFTTVALVKQPERGSEDLVE
jgi:hypothetical protein